MTRSLTGIEIFVFPLNLVESSIVSLYSPVFNPDGIEMKSSKIFKGGTILLVIGLLVVGILQS